jgi:tetratricopeptide (TPR) repeat protein
LIGECRHRYPDATHALMVDPDWLPLNVAPLPPSPATVFSIRVLRSGTERLLERCFRLDASAHFTYRWREQLQVDVHRATVLNWTVHEVSPLSEARVVTALDMLKLDLQENSTDARTRYSVGVAYLELAAVRRGTAKEKALRSGLKHLRKHVALDGTSETTYAALVRSGTTLAALRDISGAEETLRAARELDPRRAEAPVALAHLFRRDDRMADALASVRYAAALKEPARGFEHRALLYACEAPLLLWQLGGSPVAYLRARRPRPFRCDVEAVIYAPAQAKTQCPPELLHDEEETPVDDWVPAGAPDARRPCPEAAARDTRRALDLWTGGAAANAYRLLEGASSANCCDPYRELSRWFLGEAPPAKQLNRSARAELYQAMVEASGDWSGIARYGRAALQWLDGDTQAAATLGLTPRILVQHRQRPKTNGPVRVACVATQETQGLLALRESARDAGVELEVLGMGSSYSGHEEKLRLWHDFVAGMEPDALVLFVDGYDVLLWPAMRELEARFLGMDADIVFGGDAHCYPDEALATLYPTTEGKRYVNSGTLVGSAASLTLLLKAVAEYGPVTTCGPDDQRAFHRAYLEGVDGLTMRIDAKEELFHTLHGELRELKVDRRGQLTVDGKAPLATHGNAGDGKKLLANCHTARLEALLSGSESIVGRESFTRGIALHKAGEVDAAALSWRAYLESTPTCGGHAADAHYNLGVFHGERGELLEAAQRYDAALACAPRHELALQNAGANAINKGDAAAAVAFFARACALNPQSDAHAANLDIARRVAAEQRV